MAFHLGWAQLVWMVLAALGLIMHIVNHGKPKDEHYNAPTAFLYTIMTALLLWWGGFFG